jgi:hypothetical protein
MIPPAVGQFTRISFPSTWYVTNRPGWLLAVAACLVSGLLVQHIAAKHAPFAAGFTSADAQDAHDPSPITVDAPVAATIYPPDVAAPTFLWRDGANEPPYGAWTFPSGVARRRSRST